MNRTRQKFTRFLFLFNTLALAVLGMIFVTTRYQRPASAITINGPSGILDGASVTNSTKSRPTRFTVVPVFNEACKGCTVDESSSWICGTETASAGWDNPSQFNFPAIKEIQISEAGTDDNYQKYSVVLIPEGYECDSNGQNCKKNKCKIGNNWQECVEGYQSIKGTIKKPLEKPDYTLTVIPVQKTADGCNPFSGYTIDPVSVRQGETGRVRVSSTRKLATDNTNWKLSGFGDSACNVTNSGSNTYEVQNMQENITIYAIYETEQATSFYSFTVQPKKSNNGSCTDFSVKSRTKTLNVAYNQTGTIYMDSVIKGGGDVWELKGHDPNCSCSSDGNTSTTFTSPAMTTDVKQCAVYEKRKKEETPANPSNPGYNGDQDRTINYTFRMEPIRITTRQGFCGAAPKTTTYQVYEHRDKWEESWTDEDGNTGTTTRYGDWYRVGTNAGSVLLEADLNISCGEGEFDFYGFTRSKTGTVSPASKNTASAADAGATMYSYDVTIYAVYRRRDTLTMKFIDYYSKSTEITNDETVTVYDLEAASITAVTPLYFGDYEYTFYGFSKNPDDNISSMDELTYTVDPMKEDVTAYAEYRKMPVLTVIPVNENGKVIDEWYQDKTYEHTTAAVVIRPFVEDEGHEYSYRGYEKDTFNNNPEPFDGTYRITVPDIRVHTTIYAIYETTDNIATDCNASKNDVVDVHVRNIRYNWNEWDTSDIIGARPSVPKYDFEETVDFCSAYYNKHAYWNYMTSLYDYAEQCGLHQNFETFNEGRDDDDQELEHIWALGYIDNGSAFLGSWSNSFQVLNKKLNNPSSKHVSQNHLSKSFFQIQNYQHLQRNNTQQNNFKAQKQSTTDSYVVETEDVSRTIHQDMKTIDFLGNTTSTEKYTSNNSCGGKKLIDNIPSPEKTAQAEVIVPYNFQNSSRIVNDSFGTKDTKGELYYYAGGEAEVYVALKVSPRSNSFTHTEVGGEYATIDDGNIYWRVKVSAKDKTTGAYFENYTNAIEYSKGGRVINYDYNPAGQEVGAVTVNISDNNTLSAGAINRKDIVIPDVTPGNEVCFSSQIWPKDSGGERNTNPNGGYIFKDDANNPMTDGWSDWSEEKCYKVASKPSLQAWGGNIISNGNIETNYIGKWHLQGVNKYYAYKGNQTYGSDNQYTFGSWGELGIISNGNVRYLSSGAVFGFNSGKLRNKSYNDIQANNMVDLVPLTFANYHQIASTPGNLHKTYTQDTSELDKNVLIERFNYNSGNNIGNTINSSTISSARNIPNVYKDNNIYYYQFVDSNTPLTINNINIPLNTTQIIHGNNIVINGNIIYGANNQTFTSFENMPKLIIIADNNLDIDYHVSRIDAILIAKKVTTCQHLDNDTGSNRSCSLPDTNQVNDGNVSEFQGTVLITNPRNRKNQLRINGTIIADTIIPNRTYGTGSGAATSYEDPKINSVTAAEIFNYDPSLYYWEENTSSNQNNTPDSSLIVVDTQEVAPRY